MKGNAALSPLSACETNAMPTCETVPSTAKVRMPEDDQWETPGVEPPQGHRHDTRIRSTAANVTRRISSRAQSMVRTVRTTFTMESLCYVNDPIWGEVNFIPISANSRWYTKLNRVVMASLYRHFPALMFTFGCGYGKHVVDPPSPKQILMNWLRFTFGISSLLAIAELVAFTTIMVTYDPPDQYGLAWLLDYWGCKNAARIKLLGEWWRLFTPALLHVSWMHIIGNLALQLHVGIMYEVDWGPPLYLLIFVASSVAGFLLSCVVAPEDLTAGASAALFGLMGAATVDLAFRWNTFIPNERYLRDNERFRLIMFLVPNICLSFLKGTDLWAHGGGLVMGASFGLMFLAGRKRKKTTEWMLRVGGFVLIVGQFAFMFCKFIETTDVSMGLVEFRNKPPVSCPTCAELLADR